MLLSVWSCSPEKVVRNQQNGCSYHAADKARRLIRCVKTHPAPNIHRCDRTGQTKCMIAAFRDIDGNRFDRTTAKRDMEEEKRRTNERPTKLAPAK